MKKILPILLACVLTLVPAFCLAGCTNGPLVPNLYVYDFADQYKTASEGLSEIEWSDVKSLHIDWSAGEVLLGEAADDALCVDVSETSTTPLSDEQLLRWRLHDGILDIRFTASGFSLAAPTLHKTLTVRIPAAAALKEMVIDTTSAAVKADAARADQIRVDTASGGVKLDGVRADSLDVDTASGGVEVNSVSINTLNVGTASGSVTVSGDTIGRLDVDTASGSVTVSGGQIGAIDAESSSGDVTVSGDSIAKLDVDSSSGKVDVRCKKTGTPDIETASGSVTVRIDEDYDGLKIDTASGKVTLTLPAELGCELDVDTASGDFESGIPFTIRGDTYVIGDGQRKIDVSTASGDIRVLAAE